MEDTGSNGSQPYVNELSEAATNGNGMETRDEPWVLIESPATLVHTDEKHQDKNQCEAATNGNNPETSGEARSLINEPATMWHENEVHQHKNQRKIMRWKKYFSDQERKQKRKIQILQKDIKRLKDSHKNEKTEYEKNINRAKTNIVRLQDEKVTLCSQNKQMEQQIREWTTAYRDLENNNLQQINQNVRMTEEKDRTLHLLQDQVKKLDQERSTLVLRLSKIAGAKLTTNNANIADLSDENRPTKLAEKFSELYDNEWTDAFEEVCENADEKEGIQFMLQLLQRAFSLCTEMSNDHIESLKRSATTTKYTTAERAKTVKENSKIEIHNTNVDTGKSEPFVESCSSTVVDISIPGALTSEYLKQLLDMRKAFGLQMEPLVIEKVTNSIAAEFDLDLDKRTMTCKYIKKCVQLCWSMGLKDPPVYMNIINPDTDTKFDTDVYKAYTKTGKRLLFVVWPPLYLHKGGSLLSKGVAQGVGK